MMTSRLRSAKYIALDTAACSGKLRHSNNGHFERQNRLGPAFYINKHAKEQNLANHRSNDTVV